MTKKVITPQIVRLKYMHLIMCQVEIKLLREKCEEPNNMWTSCAYPLI